LDFPVKSYKQSKSLVKSVLNKIKKEINRNTRPAHVEGVKARGAFTYPFARVPTVADRWDRVDLNRGGREKQRRGGTPAMLTGDRDGGWARGWVERNELEEAVLPVPAARLEVDV
jgi:hypothetical protein